MRKKQKVGRNDPCPCGSGKKYKHCHAAQGNAFAPNLWNQVGKARARQEAHELQRKQQQGLGRPIISTELNDVRFVAVGNTIFRSKKWQTFHDFLCQYITSVLGKDWGDAELRKPIHERHPLCVWYHHVCQLQRQTISTPGRVHTAPMTGAAAAWLHLAYDLYSLAHNAELQSKLVARLKNHDGFRGARYEIFVAAALIRAGFTIEFENEDERSSTHCEFTATCKASGRKYSVEAKQRNPTDQIGGASGKFRLMRRLNKALRKAAKHDRIVFIDINVPDVASEPEIPRVLQRALTDLRAFEGRRLHGKPLPPAYVFVTNHPFEHNLEGYTYRTLVLAEGFQIPEFKSDTSFHSIRAAYEARKAHADMHQLLASLHDYREIPSTFDGEAPELAFGDNPPRLVIGETYLIPDDEGRHVPGKLTAATVDVNEGVVYCGFSRENGEAIIATDRLSEAELAAYKRHPDTFFGVPLKAPREIKTSLEFFDFVHEACRHTPRHKLLEFMKGAADIEQLRKLPQEELALIYAERCTYAAIKQK